MHVQYFHALVLEILAYPIFMIDKFVEGHWLDLNIFKLSRDLAW